MVYTSNYTYIIIIIESIMLIAMDVAIDSEVVVKLLYTNII